MESSQSGQWYALAKGTVLRDYTIESVLGQGGFGIVYRARHNEVGHLVAIKEFLPAELVVRVRATVVPRSEDCEEHYEDGLRRFREEARALIKMNGHPNIVACMDFFRANGTAYLVMEFVDGQPLAEVLRGREVESRPFEEAELLAIAVPLAEGLAHVHRHGVLHRDIKPANVLIRRSDGQPVLIDFGAAKQGVATHTRSFAPYTDGYAALEQVSGGTLGPWTDLYGFGALMWRLVASGNHDWKQSNPSKVESRMSAVIRGDSDPLPSARELGRERFSPSIVRLIDQCLKLNPEQRTQDSDKVLRILNDDARPAREVHSPPLRISRSANAPDSVPQFHQDRQVRADMDQQVQVEPQETNTPPGLNYPSNFRTTVREIRSRLKGTLRGSRHIFTEIAADRSATRQMVLTMYLVCVFHTLSLHWGSVQWSFGILTRSSTTFSSNGWKWGEIVFYAVGVLAATLASVACFAFTYWIVAKWFNTNAPTYSHWFRVHGFITVACAIIALVPFVGSLTSMVYHVVLEVIATSELTGTRIRVALMIALIALFLGAIPHLIKGYMVSLL